MGTVILIAFVAVLGAFGAAMALDAYARFGVVVINRRFFVEVAVLAAGLAAVLWGLPMAAVAYGVVP